MVTKTTSISITVSLNPTLHNQCTTCWVVIQRTIKGKLPVWKKHNLVNRHKQARENEEQKKEYNKTYADKKRHTKKSDIKIGDSVLVRQEKRNKLTPRFNPEPYTVTQRHNARVTARSKNGHTITRNASHFKPIPQHNSETDEDEDDDVKTPASNENEDRSQASDPCPTQQAPRRSTRTKKRPERFGTPVCWEIIKKNKGEWCNIISIINIINGTDRKATNTRKNS